MAIRDLIPWNWGEKQVPVKREEEAYPLQDFHRRVDQLFDNFFNEFSLAPFGNSFGAFQPNIDVSESEQDVVVSAELPGLDENDIEVGLSRNSLTISGEKRAEKEDKGKNYYRMERSYGSFKRTIPLSTEIDADKVEATFKKGVLTVTLPKVATPAGERKKIAIRHP